MKDIIKQFRIDNVGKFRLKDHKPGFDGGYDKDGAGDILDSLKMEMDDLQEKLYAANKHALLIIFQAMDAGGKDSIIEHTMSGLNPQGCQVYSFKQPSAEELDHDFLWRHARALPERGRIGIHNRSHYENVLVCKVHPSYVLNERIAAVSKVDDIDEKFWEGRYESIRDFEKHLDRNGTVILKFFLNVSRKEQKERFLERIEDPRKNWKFSHGDIEERRLWDDYMNAYERAITETSTKYAPWYIIPADKKWFTRIAVSSVITETLKSLSPEIPELAASERAKLEECRKELLAEE